jgi:plastocyanin
MRRSLSLVVVALLVFAACSDDKKTTATSSGSASSSSKDAGGPQTVTVNVDAPIEDTPVGYTAYFPNDVTLHAGDTIEFDSHFNGEPHTVTFSTLLDEGLKKADPNAEEEPAELKKLPPLLPDGPGDAIQAAAQPCFLANGDPPQSDACTKDQQKQVDFTGKQTFYNSGFLADGDTFEMKLADDLAPGTYNWFCLLHRGGMTGKLTVVAASEKAQTADEVKSAADKAMKDNNDKLAANVTAVKAGTFPPFITKADPKQVIAGGGSEDIEAAYIARFGPDKTDVKVGDKVTWVVIGPHTITFGGDESLRTILSKAPDGSVHLTEAAVTPAGGAGQPEQDPNAPPPAQGAPPIDIDGGSYDGTGLHNSGAIFSFPPQLFTYSLTFTKAGSYEYFCAIHPDMKGTVNVT